VLFVGTHEHTIDAKQRLAIPSEYRKPRPSDRDDAKGAGEPQIFFAALGEEKTLTLYTEQGFADRARELESSDRPPEEVLLYEKLLYANAARMELDKQAAQAHRARQGRRARGHERSPCGPRPTQVERVDGPAPDRAARPAGEPQAADPPRFPGPPNRPGRSEAMTDPVSPDPRSCPPLSTRWPARA
jgi:hypothetical protein